jgi:hypothetical protein
MLNTEDYQLQDILYRACGRTAQSSDSASAREVGKYNHVGKAHVLEVNKGDVTLHNAIDVYNR